MGARVRERKTTKSRIRKIKREIERKIYIAYLLNDICALIVATMFATVRCTTNSFWIEWW